MTSKAIYRLLFLLISISATIDAVGQKQKTFLQIGRKQIFFELEEKLTVWRTVSDTFLFCENERLKNFPLGTNTVSTEIARNDFKTMHREVFNDKGCIWTRLTNDKLKEGSQPFVQLTLLNDSSCFILRPSSCHRHDTVMQINPITLEEEMVIVIDSISKAKFDLGDISKSQLIDAISNNFYVERGIMNLRISYVWIMLFNKTCNGIEVNYTNKDSPKQTQQMITNFPAGSTAFIERILFEDSKGREFNVALWDVARFRLID